MPLPLHVREQDREADRDLWEQRTERFQVGRAACGVSPSLPPLSPWLLSSVRSHDLAYLPTSHDLA